MRMIGDETRARRLDRRSILARKPTQASRAARLRRSLLSITQAPPVGVNTLASICLSLLLIFTLTGCTGAGAAPGVSAPATAPANNTSTAHFAFSSDKAASYTLHTSTPTSELRHGHREFTIILKDAGVSLFIVFYGYQGPGRYTLTDSVNGGDVHVGLEHDTISWDLMMQPMDHCDLLVASDLSTNSPGLDRMRGSFSCPRLLSSSPAHPQKPVMIENGSFDIAILVAS